MIPDPEGFEPVGAAVARVIGDIAQTVLRDEQSIIQEGELTRKTGEDWGSRAVPGNTDGGRMIADEREDAACHAFAACVNMLTKGAERYSGQTRDALLEAAIAIGNAGRRAAGRIAGAPLSRQSSPHTNGAA